MRSGFSYWGVTFTRVAYTGLPNEPNGFNFTYVFSSNGFHGYGAVPSRDGAYAYSTGTGQAAGYIAYPSKEFIEFLVKG